MDEGGPPGRATETAPGAAGLTCTVWALEVMAAAELPGAEAALWLAGAVGLEGLQAASAARATRATPVRPEVLLIVSMAND